VLLRFIKRVNFMVDFLTAATFVIMTLGVLIAVSGRYLFRYPLPSAMEAAYYAMLWCAFLQTGKALFEEKHVNMPFLADRLSGTSKAVHCIMINLIILVSALFMGYYSVSFTFESFLLKWHTSGSLPVPMFYLYGVMFFGIVYLGFIVIFNVIECGKQIRKPN
jgi:TRAP-type C4-dicarboxylate transport system permease small subunit